MHSIVSTKKRKIVLKTLHFSRISIKCSAKLKVKCIINKDQAIGGIMFVVCAVVDILFIVTLFYPQWVSMVGIHMIGTEIQLWIAVPISVLFLTMIGILARIGWNMATTASKADRRDSE
jgi:hypothetical protein